jgi:hypothetical protein
MSENPKEDRAREQAKLQLEGIIQMVKRLEHSQECSGDEDCALTGKEIIEGLGNSYTEGGKANEEDRENYHDEEAAREAFTEDALSVEVRSGWHEPGGDNTALEYSILLCTGGPAVRIIGDLDEYQQPISAKLQYQDWFTPWQPLLPLAEGEHEALLTYARQFYFGE